MGDRGAPFELHRWVAESDPKRWRRCRHELLQYQSHHLLLATSAKSAGRMTALRLFAAAIELEGDRRAGQGIREIVEIIDKDVPKFVRCWTRRGLAKREEAA